MKVKVVIVAIVLVALSAPLCALKSRERTFAQNCELVWKATMAVAKSQEYRIIAISKEDQIISLAVGGFIAGERIISLNLTGLSGDGCRVSVQSRFSGLIHSDGPDLLRRIQVEIVGNYLDRDSKTFRQFKSCMEWDKNEDRCERRLRKDIAKNETKDPALPALPEDWWPSTAKKEKP